MGSWQVTDEAVKGMENMAHRLNEVTQEIKREIEMLKNSYEQNREGLGAHSNEISNLIDELEHITEEAGRPVWKLVIKLHSAARIRQNHIQNNRY